MSRWSASAGGYVGRQPQERAVVLVGLDGQTAPAAQNQIRAEVARYAAQKCAPLARGLMVEPCREGGGGGLAVGAGYGHDELVVAEVAEHLRALLYREAPAAEPLPFAMVGGYGGGIYHHRRFSVAECVGDERRVVLVVYRRALAREGVGQRRAGTVVAGHGASLVQEVTRQRAHSYAAYSQKIYLVEFHPFQMCFGSSLLSVHAASLGRGVLRITISSLSAPRCGRPSRLSRARLCFARDVAGARRWP